MSFQNPMQALHDRATRGQILTPDEQSALDAWYAAHDAEEIAALGRTATFDDLRALDAGVAHVIAGIIDAARTIQELTAQHAHLRAEIAELQQRL